MFDNKPNILLMIRKLMCIVLQKWGKLRRHIKYNLQLKIFFQSVL